MTGAPMATFSTADSSFTAAVGIKVGNKDKSGKLPHNPDSQSGKEESKGTDERKKETGG